MGKTATPKKCMKSSRSAECPWLPLSLVFTTHETLWRRLRHGACGLSHVFVPGIGKVRWIARPENNVTNVQHLTICACLRWSLICVGMPDDCSRMAHEVHERSCDEDILLIMLREILKHNPECKLRVILMSATLSQTIRNTLDDMLP